MHVLDIIFWTFFAGTVAFIAWVFLRLLYETIVDRRPAKRAPHRASAMGGGESVSSDYGTSATGDAGGGESNGGGDSGGGSDFSGGGGESGGGGSSGGW